MARKFLYLVAIVIILFLGGAIWISLNPEQATRYYYDGLAYQAVPDAEFVEQETLEDNIYADPGMWFARTGLKSNNPALWKPEGAPQDETPGPAAIFFVHPTSFIDNKRWNAPLDDAETNNRARIFLRGLASPFASAGEIWAPKYRQATVGAFLTEKPEGQSALDAAYQDVLQAFDYFVEQQEPDRPIILAGHSQGARHLTYLLRDRVAGKPLKDRIAAAYIVGWPVSVERDLQSLGLPGCSNAEETGCMMSWQSFAEPANYDRIIELYDQSPGLDGEMRKGSEMLCTNPLNGGAAQEAEASENLGTLRPNLDLTEGELIASAVPARCDERGFLLIGDPPELGPYVLPGNNYHVYDIPLFWSNIRRDVLLRLRNHLAQ